MPCRALVAGPFGEQFEPLANAILPLFSTGFARPAQVDRRLGARKIVAASRLFCHWLDDKMGKRATAR